MLTSACDGLPKHPSRLSSLLLTADSSHVAWTDDMGAPRATQQRRHARDREEPDAPFREPDAHGRTCGLPRTHSSPRAGPHARLAREALATLNRR